MNYRPYCIPCFLRRTLHTAELATSDEWLHRKILAEIMADLLKAEEQATPAEVVHSIFRKTARTLGFAEADYITASYSGLYLQDCARRGVPPGDMVFATQPGQAPSV
jgi:hypothetical protein